VVIDALQHGTTLAAAGLSAIWVLLLATGPGARIVASVVAGIGLL
jgi:hypothetical protein